MKQPDRHRIRKAIDSAESGTSGRIGVRIVSHNTADALEDARRQFIHAKLHHHGPRNAVVFYVAPKARRFAVFGDEAIHARVGDVFWTQLVDDMQPYFANGDMTDGLELGIARVGEQLRSHFSA